MRRYLKLFLISIFCCICVPGQPAQAQEPTLPGLEPALAFTHLTAEDGLAQNRVTTIHQDSRGFMWIGSQNGLSRYDGYRFTLYKHNLDDPHSLSHNFVRDILEDTEGNLWIATQGGGLNRFDPYTETFTSYQIEGLNGKIFSLFQDGAGRLWLGGPPTVGLIAFDPETEAITRYRPRSASTEQVEISAGIPLDHFLGGGVWQITSDQAGNLWLATDEMPVKFDPQTEQFTHYPLQADERLLTVLHRDSAGTIWAAGLTGLYRFDLQAEIFIPYPGNPGQISSLIEATNGRFWLGTRQTGLYLFDPETGQFIRHYRHDPANGRSLSSDQIATLYQDEAGVIWIGSEDSGLNVVDPRQSQFAYYRHRSDDPQGLSPGPITALTGTEDGVLWVGAGAFLDRIGPEGVKHYVPATDPESSTQDNVSALYVDRQGLVWLGLNRKLYRFDATTEQFTEYELRLSDRPGPPLRVTSFYEDEAGYLWLAVEETGLYRFDREEESFQIYQRPRDPQVTNYDDPHNLANNHLRVLYGDRQGYIWLGYQNGVLSRFDPRTESFRHYFLEAGWIEAIYMDKADRLWLASQAGLIRFDPQTETSTQYTRQDGLPDEFVVGILEERSGNLWLSSKQGLIRFNPQAETFRHYGLSDGLSDTEFNRGAAWQAPDGQIFFGGKNGLTAFYPAQINPNRYQPPVVLTEFRLFNEPVAPGPDSPLSRSIWAVDRLTLQPDQDIIAFEFAALSYAAPWKNRYRYKLDGFETDWNEVNSQRRFAAYTNLPPGEYLFRAQGTNNDGLWSDREARLSLVVLPFWWETSWFHAIAFLLAAAIAFGGYRWRVYTLQQRSRHLERVVSQRTAELEQAREIFATVLNNQDALIYVADMTTYEVLFANDRLKQEFGEVEGLTCWQALQENQSDPCCFCSNPELLTPEGEPAGIYRWQFQNTRNGHWYALADSAIEWTDGRLVRLSMAMDITTHKEAEQQLLTQQRLVAAMEERERIGRELHDDLGQVMGYVSLQAQAARELLKQGQTDQAAATLIHLAQAANEAHDDVRQYILGVRTSAPSPADFFEALSQYLRQLHDRYGLEVHLSGLENWTDSPLALEVETQLLRIIQEALTNVRKHAGVETARLLFTLGTDEAQVAIIDEGAGFDLSQLEEGGFGLTIMRERAEAVGGSLELHSEPGRGTQVIAYLPRLLENHIQNGVRGLRVMLVDDHPLYLAGMRNMLSTRGVQIIGTAHDGLEAVELARRLLPDLILMDVEMPRCNGLEATRRIKADLPDIKIVILTVAADDETLFDALKSGAEGYLLKNLDSRQFFNLLSNVMAGETVLSPSLAARVLTEFSRRDTPPVDDTPTLTPRQLEVLELAAQGLGNKEIAEELHITPATVKYHITQILKRLQLKSRYELAEYARRQDLL